MSRLLLIVCLAILGTSMAFMPAMGRMGSKAVVSSKTAQVEINHPTVVL